MNGYTMDGSSPEPGVTPDAHEEQGIVRLRQSRDLPSRVGPVLLAVKIGPLNSSCAFGPYRVHVPKLDGIHNALITQYLDLLDLSASHLDQDRRSSFRYAPLTVDN